MKNFFALWLCFLILLSVLFTGCQPIEGPSSEEEEQVTVADDEENDSVTEESSPEVVDPQYVTYSKALQELNAGNIEKAYDLFLTLKDYRDVSEYLKRFSFHYATKITYSPKSVQGNYFEYDEYGKPTLKVYGQEKYAYEYDKDQNLIKETQYFGLNKYVTVYEYDEKGNPIRSTADTGYSVVLEYDDAGNHVKTIYPDSTREMYYDDLGRLLKTISMDSEGIVTLTHLQEYDEQGNCIKHTVTHSGGTTVTLNQFDSQGRLIKQRVEQSNGYRYTNEYQFDDRGNQIVSKHYRSEQDFSIFTWEYDENDNVIEARREDENGVDYIDSFEYDEKGNCIKETHTIPQYLTSISYHEYDSYGNLIKTIASGETDSPDDYWITVYSGYQLYYNPYAAKILPEEFTGK